ncbi:hypothetical protein C0584_02300 [Candidatus Parcubacteria bacterium]|nr:MAG: hypothetical protein C0584_02300 [Candidatus Parcubacteria bacterium]
MQTIKLELSNLHCMSCKLIIETELKDIEGVQKINVNHIKENAVLVVNSDEAKNNSFKKLKSLGYGIKSFSVK